MTRYPSDVQRCDPALAAERPSPWVAVTASLLLLLMAGRAVHSMSAKSVTVDEIMYIAAGFYHVKTGDFELNMTNTPLMKTLCGLPLLWTGASLPSFEGSPEEWSIIRQWQFARSFLYGNAVDADRLLFIARVPVVLLALLLGYYVFRWARELYGAGAGLLSLFLFSFSPNMLAHARLATHEFGLVVFMFLATYYFWRYLKENRLCALILCGILSGCALLTKTTAIFLAPAFGAFVLMCLFANNGLGIDPRFPGVCADANRQRLAQFVTAVWSFGIIGALTLLMLNVGYGFQGSMQPLPVPSPFLTMLKNQSGTVSSLGNVYFAGDIYPHGLWHLTLTSFFLKTPIALVALVGAAVATRVTRWRTLQAEWLLIILAGLLVFVFSFLVKSGVGLRYILPVYPALHVLAGRLGGSGWPRLRAARAGILLMGAWYSISSFSIHPHYLAYFNELAGGPENGYTILADANLDWGQDLKGLADYLDERDVDSVYLGYFGSADADYYGINYHYLPSVGLAPKGRNGQWWYDMTAPAARIPLAPGTYAISANLIAGQAWMHDMFHESYAPFRGREPDEMVGYSILIFDVEPPTAADDRAPEPVGTTAE